MKISPVKNYCTVPIPATTNPLIRSITLGTNYESSIRQRTISTTVVNESNDARISESYNTNLLHANTLNNNLCRTQSVPLCKEKYRMKVVAREEFLNNYIIAKDICNKNIFVDNRSTPNHNRDVKSALQYTLSVGGVIDFSKGIVISPKGKDVLKKSEDIFRDGDIKTADIEIEKEMNLNNADSSTNEAASTDIIFSKNPGKSSTNTFSNTSSKNLFQKIRKLGDSFDRSRDKFMVNVISKPAKNLSEKLSMSPQSSEGHPQIFVRAVSSTFMMLLTLILVIFEVDLHHKVVVLICQTVEAYTLFRQYQTNNFKYFLVRSFTTTIKALMRFHLGVCGRRSIYGLFFWDDKTMERERNKLIDSGRFPDGFIKHENRFSYCMYMSDFKVENGILLEEETGIWLSRVTSILGGIISILLVINFLLHYKYPHYGAKVVQIDVQEKDGGENENSINSKNSVFSTASKELTKTDEAKTNEIVINANQSENQANHESSTTTLLIRGCAWFKWRMYFQYAFIITEFVFLYTKAIIIPETSTWRRGSVEIVGHLLMMLVFRPINMMSLRHQWVHPV